MAIHAFYKHVHQFKQLMSANRNLNCGFYFRLMAISVVEIIGTIPFGTYWIVFHARNGLGPWKSWAYQHADYSHIPQIPASIWKDDHHLVVALELTRWSLVVCAFIFFAFFGFAEEARQHYRFIYTSLFHRKKRQNLAV
jgi:pheromone a factor receptor